MFISRPTETTSTKRAESRVWAKVRLDPTRILRDQDPSQQRHNPLAQIKQSMTVSLGGLGCGEAAGQVGLSNLGLAHGDQTSSTLTLVHISIRIDT